MHELTSMLLKITVSIFALAFILFAIAKLIKIKKGQEIWPYYAKKIMSKPEMIFYYRLVNTLPDQIILAQVQLSRVLGVKSGANFGEWHNRINRMSLDFVVCRREDTSIIAVIELDDKSHEREERVKADEKKNQALTSANIRIIRWKIQDMPDEKTIRQVLAEA